MLIQMLSIGRRFWFVFLVFLTLVGGLVLSLVRSPEPAVAQVSLYYPETCLGGWQQSKEAAFAPDAADDEIRRGVSVYDNNGASIFCGEFTGTLPPQTYHTRVTLRFDWHQPLPKVITDEVIEGDSTPNVFEQNSLDEEIVHETNTSGLTDFEVATGTESVSGEVVLDTDVASSTDSGEPVEEPIATSTIDTSVPVMDGSEASSGTQVVDPEPLPEPIVPVDASVTESIPETNVQEAPVVELDEIKVEEVITEIQPDTVVSLSRWLRDFMIATVFAETTSTTTVTEMVMDPLAVEEIPTTSTEMVSVTDLVTTTDSVPVDVLLASTTPTTELGVATSTMSLPAETIFAVQYTLDGDIWETLGYVTTISSDVRFEFPKSVFKSVSDISLVQIALVPQLTLDTVLPIYLDAMWLEVGYAPVRELGVHTISTIKPSVVPFAALIEFPTDVIPDAVAVEATSTATTTTLAPLFSSEVFAERIVSVHGVDDRYVVVTLAMSTTSTEVWLFDMRQELIHRIGVGEAVIGQYPVGVKDDMIFWFNYLDEVVFVYDLRTAGQLHEMALVANLPSASEHRLTFPFTDWEVIWRSDQFYFYTKATGEVFQDENTEAASQFYNFFQLKKQLPRARLDEIGGIVIPESE